jgi:DedD protein
MAFFKFRKGGDAQSAPVPAPESVEAVRRRARHRLIGSAVLVLVGVIGFPLLFDSQPRPIAVDIPIEIPDRNKVKPLGNLPVIAPAAQSSGAVITEEAPASKPVATAPPPAPVASVATNSPTRAVVGAVASASAPVKAETKALPEKSTPPHPVSSPVKSDDGSKAQALLEGKEPAAATGPRFIVQVGAFAEAAKAQDVRKKVEKAGLKTYTHVAQLKEGKRIRVRVGPFDSRAAAEKAAEKIKKLELSAAILEL